ncbi:MAG: hypothetical protein SOY54_03150 [Bacilli bacterium]|nr:hypothetical protein [Bacilli bacterium]
MMETTDKIQSQKKVSKEITNNITKKIIFLEKSNYDKGFEYSQNEMVRRIKLIIEEEVRKNENK